jgi:hypothetical protein
MRAHRKGWRCHLQSQDASILRRRLARFPTFHPTCVPAIPPTQIWMKAEVSDGQGRVYAGARALFVAPRKTDLLFGWIPGYRSLRKPSPNV